jgi:hypothetical protein
MTVLDVDARIIDKRQARERLMEIDQYFSPEDQSLSIMNDQEREQTLTSLEIERLWLQLKLGIITQAEKQQSLEGICKELKENKPGVYNWLFAEDKQGLSMVRRIRDKVFPPIYVGQYYTKRQK